MDVASLCIILMVSWHGGSADGSAILNLDGSWTVDWPAIEELARQPLINPGPEIAGRGVDLSQGGYTFAAGHQHMQFEILTARALLKQREAGTIVENLNPDNTCPEN